MILLIIISTNNILLNLLIKLIYYLIFIGLIFNITIFIYLLLKISFLHFVVLETVANTVGTNFQRLLREYSY